MFLQKLYFLICHPGENQAVYHSTYSQAVTQEMLNNFADIANVEIVVIDENTEIRTFKQRLN